METGGSNVQFGINPADGEMVVIEMNPRVSRSSALASKATGFPIAKIAAKLAVGYALWELPNDITGETVACFEPSIDYVVTKIPRWTFEKFPEADETLTTQMKSVGEGMSIGRTFKESLQKGIRSMEVKRFGFGLDAQDKWLAKEQDRNLDARGEERWPIEPGKLRRKLEVPSQGRMYYLRYAFKSGWSVKEVFEATKIDPWFLHQLFELVGFEDRLTAVGSLEDLPRDLLFEAKQLGYSDAQLAQLYLGDITPQSVLRVRAHRKEAGVTPVYKLVDTCAAEFEARTPYYYATYERPYARVGEDGQADADEVRLTQKKKIVILGGGPNRIGQGIEFDYCCVQAAFAAQELGFEAVLVNSNPETVSTDYDTSDLLFFEPLTLEDVLNVCERVNGGPLDGSEGLLAGVVVQFGGQTPLNLAAGLESAGVPIIGTSVDAIDLAEDRDRFAALCDELGVRQPENGIARGVDEAVTIAERIGYPVLVRPSFVLGGRAMETVFDDGQLRRYMVDALGASDLAGQPILVDNFLFNATECDVDVVADFGKQSASAAGSAGSPDFERHPPRAIVAAVMEHIEEAGIHSGDSACTIPPHSLAPQTVEEIKRLSRAMAERLGVRGLMNCQWAVQKNARTGADEINVIEVNPRASRTVPFVGKATGIGWANIAAKVMMGRQLGELGVVEEVDPPHHAVKESVFPFSKFPGVDVILGPEMRSTGECMGIDADFAVAFAKSQMAAGTFLPTEGLAFLSVRTEDREAAVPIAEGLLAQGFSLCGTGGTAGFLGSRGVDIKRVPKIVEGGRPNAIDLIKNRDLALLINTPTRKGAGTDEGKIRATAVRHGVPMITTMTAAKLAVDAIARLREGSWGVKSLQEYAGS